MKIIQGIKILCPIDFDVNSLAALDLAHDLVRENGGTVYALHVVKLPDLTHISAAAGRAGAPVCPNQLG